MPIAVSASTSERSLSLEVEAIEDALECLVAECSEGLIEDLETELALEVTLGLGATELMASDRGRLVAGGGMALLSIS